MSIRVFVGLQLSIMATRQLTQAAEPQRRAVESAGGNAAWVPAKNQHITLKFIGNIADELLEGVVLAVRKAAAETAPLRVTVKGFGAFGDLILWAGIDSSGDAVAKLQAAIETQLEAAGFAREARAFHPHVTLGRVQKIAAAKIGAENSSAVATDAVKNAAAMWCKSDIAVTESLIESVVVFESRMMPTGVAYIERARLPLDLVNAQRRKDLEIVQRARGENADVANQ